MNRIISFLTLKILLYLLGFSSFAQSIEINGKVSDSLQNPLAYANILAIPEAEDQDITYAITQENGTYKQGLSKKAILFLKTIEGNP